MTNIWCRIKTTLGSMRMASKIAKFPGGSDALKTKLSELHAALSASDMRRSCPHCGSTDLEPTETRTSSAGTVVSQFRCKACGKESDKG